MSAIELMNHELFLKGHDNLEVVVSVSCHDGFDLYDRFTGEQLATWEDSSEATYAIQVLP